MGYLLLVLVALSEGASPPPAPDVRATIETLVEEQGFGISNFTVVTPDHCNLTVFHITSPKGKGTKGPVFVLHGVLDSADTWVVNSAEQSLAFILANEGYDVFLGNSRGNKYATGVTTHRPHSAKYWEWSFDDMAKYDMPAQVDAVLKRTQQASLRMVCHSQGCTQSIMALTENYGNLSHKISHLVGLAPVTALEHQNSVLLQALSLLPATSIIKLLGDDDFLPDSKLLNHLLPKICGNDPHLCDNVMYLLVGNNITNLNQTRLPVYLSHFPSGTSMVNMDHWVQYVRAKRTIHELFNMYDFDFLSFVPIVKDLGWSNLAHYGQLTPPKYNLTKFPSAQVKLSVFHGSLDTLADPKDVQWFMSKLPANVSFQQYLPGYSHLDFVWSMFAYKTVYPNVLHALQL
jgi:pimeloyl-ACP methyl ester carboxylesterase